MTVLYTLSLHDALPIYERVLEPPVRRVEQLLQAVRTGGQVRGDRVLPVPVPVEAGFDLEPSHADQIGSTRLNSSHVKISYAVFCLKKKRRRKQYSKHRS